MGAEVKDDNELEQPEEADEDVVEEDSPSSTTSSDENEDDSDETSLDELLSQRAAARRTGDDSNEEDDIMALSSEPQSPTGEPLPTRVIPVKDRQEFVCSNCHLVKARSQLADEKRMLCRDCA